MEFLVPSDFWIRREVGQRKKKEKVPQRPVFDIHQAKHEVRKLAISTMRKAGKQEARAALAISLGAIAPKAKAVHYKEVRSVALVLFLVWALCLCDAKFAMVSPSFSSTQLPLSPTQSTRPRELGEAGGTSWLEDQPGLLGPIGSGEPDRVFFCVWVLPVQLKEAKRAEKEELQRRRQGDEVFASRVGQMARKPAARDDKKKKNNKNRVAGFDAGFGKASQAGRARAGLRK